MVREAQTHVDLMTGEEVADLRVSLEQATTLITAYGGSAQLPSLPLSSAPTCHYTQRFKLESHSAEFVRLGWRVHASVVEYVDLVCHAHLDDIDAFDGQTRILYFHPRPLKDVYEEMKVQLLRRLNDRVFASQDEMRQALADVGWLYLSPDVAHQIFPAGFKLGIPDWAQVHGYLIELKRGGLKVRCRGQRPKDPVEQARQFYLANY